jgi:hypothetical protein
MSTDSLPTASPEAPSPAGPLADAAGGAATEPEFAAYLRELPRLLAEGHAGRYALLKGDEVLSVWDTQRDVLQAGYERFGLQPFSVKRIDPRDPERISAIRASERTVCPS